MQDIDKFPLVTIITLTYNNCEFVFDNIDSVLKQTYKHFELIIADASRMANVRKVCESYNDHRIKYMHLPENKGISANTNAGLRTANGDYVGLLDHDDLLTPDCLYEYASLMRPVLYPCIGFAIIAIAVSFALYALSKKIKKELKQKELQELAEADKP